MQKSASIFLLGILLLISSCAYLDRKKEIINSWKVVDIQLVPLDAKELSTRSQQEIEHNIFYTFRSDGTYEVHHQKVNDRGRWILSEDQKVLLLNSAKNKQDDAEFIIESFTQEQIVISSQMDDVKEVITLKAID